MYRFALRPRWLAVHLGLVAVVAACLLLSSWQWDRHEQRSARNDAIAANAERPPAPLGTVLDAGGAVGPATEWRPVTVTGRYDAAATVLVRNRSREGVGRGVEVLVPLRTAAGDTVLVHRGLVPAAGTAAGRVEVPAPPPGEVTVTGRLRAAESASDRERGQATGGEQPTLVRIDVPAVADLVGSPLYAGGYLELVAEEPAADPAPLPPAAPQPDGGTNLAYSMQWAFFGLAAVGGWVVLLRREAHEARAARTDPMEVDAWPAGSRTTP